MFALSARIDAAIGALTESGKILLTKSTRILDIGSGPNLGWVLELFSEHRFDSYLAIDKRPLEELQFTPTTFRECDSEERKIHNPCDLECRFNYWNRLTASPAPMTLEDFRKTVQVRTCVNLEESRLAHELGGTGLYDLIIASDIVHVLSDFDARVRLVTDIKEAKAPGGTILVRGFVEANTYGFLSQDELGRIDTVLGGFEEFETEGIPKRTTRLYR